jgi:hypothetical protein
VDGDLSVAVPAVEGVLETDARTYNVCLECGRGPAKQQDPGPGFIWSYLVDVAVVFGIRDGDMACILDGTAPLRLQQYLKVKIGIMPYHQAISFMIVAEV